MPKMRLLALLVLLAAMAVGFLVLNRPKAGPPVGGARLSVEQGKVEVLPPDTSEWRAASDGEMLPPGTRIRTGVETRALVDFDGVAAARLDAETVITLDAVGRAPDGGTTGVSLFVEVGHVWSRVLRLLDLGASYEVQTSSTVSVVRGTAFGVRVIGSVTTVYPGESSVETTVVASGETFTVAEDIGVEVDGEGSARTVRVSERAELRDRVHLELRRDAVWIERGSPPALFAPPVLQEVTPSGSATEEIRLEIRPSEIRSAPTPTGEVPADVDSSRGPTDPSTLLLEAGTAVR